MEISSNPNPLLVRSFRAWGLNIASCIDLPDFLVGNGELPDVVVDYGAVPAELDGAMAKGILYQAAPGRFLLKIKNVANYLVEDGCKISIQRADGAEDAVIRLFLQGSAFGALLHQRGLLPLHASAILANGKAILFCGVSGAGKSTLAGAFCERGYPVLTDDICALSSVAGEVPMILPGFAQIKLWADAARKLKKDPSSLQRIRNNLEKYRLPVHDAFHADPVPLDRIYVLSSSNFDRFEIDPICGLDKLKTLLKNTYRFRFSEGLGKKLQHFNCCTVMGEYAEIRSVKRPVNGFRIDELADLIEKDFLS